MEKFIELQTVRNEKVSVNVNRVLFFAETKKSTSVVLDDGTSIDVSDDYASLSRLFSDYVENGNILPSHDGT